MDDHALLILEQALTERLAELYDGTVTLVRPKNDERVDVPAGTFHDLHDAVQAQKDPRGWRVLLRDGTGTVRFGATLAPLLRWARRGAYPRAAEPPASRAPRQGKELGRASKDVTFFMAPVESGGKAGWLVDNWFGLVNIGLPEVDPTP